jgi:hypothetical protein
VWPGAKLPRAEHLVSVRTVDELLAAGLPRNRRGLEEYAYSVNS